MKFYDSPVASIHNLIYNIYKIGDQYMDIFGMTTTRGTRTITLETIAREMKNRGYSKWELKYLDRGYGPSKVIYWNDGRGNTVLQVNTRGDSRIATVTRISSSVRALCQEVLGIKEGTTVRV